MSQTHRPLGATGRTVRPVGLGGMPMSIQGRPSEVQSLRTLTEALDLGFDLIDTADVYCLDDADLGHNERLIASALREWRGDPSKVLVATKGGCTRPGGRWDVDGRPAHLKQACDRSLKALGVERIALYQLHAPDSKVRFEDSVGALAELRAAGKIAEVGLSNVDVDQIVRASAIVPIVSVQNRLSPLDVRALKDGVVAHCAAHGITFLAYSPVGGSRGIGRLRETAALKATADRTGWTVPQVALAWLLACSPCIVPIPGASKVASARGSAAVWALTLPDDEKAALDRALLA